MQTAHLDFPQFFSPRCNIIYYRERRIWIGSKSVAGFRVVPTWGWELFAQTEPPRKAAGPDAPEGKGRAEPGEEAEEGRVRLARAPEHGRLAGHPPPPCALGSRRPASLRPGRTRRCRPGAGAVRLRDWVRSGSCGQTLSCLRARALRSPGGSLFRSLESRVLRPCAAELGAALPEPGRTARSEPWAQEAGELPGEPGRGALMARLLSR